MEQFIRKSTLMAECLLIMGKNKFGWKSYSQIKQINLKNFLLSFLN